MKYVILDIETTGLDVENSSIIEMGALLISNERIVNKFSSLVYYDRDLPETTKRITGITNSMIKDAPRLEEVLKQLKDFVQRRPVVAHNGFSFDFPFLEREGMKLSEKYDSMEFAFFVLPTSDFGHSVKALADRFSLGEETHRALPDCELEFEIIRKLQEEWKGRDKKQIKGLKFFAELVGWWWANFLPGQSEKNSNFLSFVSPYEPYRKEDVDQDLLSLGTNTIDEDEVTKFFAPGGVAEYSEDRPEQRDMAKFVAQAFNDKRHAVIEAGTGVGKSKAYLVPSVLFSMKNEIPVVISTYTKALQDQLAFKEIQHVTDIVKPDLRVAVVKGKQNYVCLNKFSEFIQEVITKISQRSLYQHEESKTRFTSRLTSLLLLSWILQSERGDWDELPYWLIESIPKRVEQDICNIDEMCTKDVCEFFDEKRCFYAKARARARDADLVIMNHAITLTGISRWLNKEDPIDSDVPSEEESVVSFSHSVLPNEAKFIIFDEAHHLEDAATSAWTSTLSRSIFERLLVQLYDKRNGVINILSSIVSTSNDKRLGELFDSFSSMEADLRLDIKTLFKEILEKLIPSNPSIKWDKKLSFDELSESPEYKENMIKILSNIARRFEVIRRALLGFAERAGSEKIKKSLRIREGIIKSAITDTIYKLVNEDDQLVRYIMRSGSTLQLLASPLSVADQMKGLVYDNFNSAIFTSATITVDDKFNFFARRSGTDLISKNQIKYIKRPSSFNYSRQVQFFVPKGIIYGSGKKEKKEHFDRCLNFLKDAVVACQGGALILCSGHEQVNQLYDGLADHFSNHNIWLLRQFKGQSITSVVRNFSSDINSVLIGTASLWQGVDVPGRSLRALFIYKIPYKVPSDPLIKARCDEIDKKGGNSYSSYYEPLAAIDLKQGIGRLVRKKTDIGIVTMLHEGFLKKDLLLNSLPSGIKVRSAEQSEVLKALSELSKLS